MSRLILVRHGQASFLEADYDRLSEKGQLQSRLLGQHWVRSGIVFDRVWTGPRLRQRDTARLAGEEYIKAGACWPDPAVIQEFDEFAAELVIQRSLPSLLGSDAEVQRLHWDFEQAAGRAEQFKRFQRMFEVIVGRWAAGDLTVDDVEPWPDFCIRVQRGLEVVIKNGSTATSSVVFTSGGPIGVAMQRALELSTKNTLRTAWMMNNAACTEFVFSGDRFTLKTYNSYPHLTDPDLVTYR